MRWFWILALSALIVSCGKNEGIVGQAPGFSPWSVGSLSSPWGFPGNGNVPTVGYPYNPGNGGNYFNPQNIPNGYGNPYTPWMPFHQWMNSDPYRSQYYQQMMNTWRWYAGNRGYGQYDFSAFWLDYMQRLWGGTQYQRVYDYFGSQVYPWLNWNTSFPQSFVNPNAYWSGYVGFPYSYLNSQFPPGDYLGLVLD